MKVLLSYFVLVVLTFQTAKSHGHGSHEHVKSKISLSCKKEVNDYLSQNELAKKIHDTDNNQFYAFIDCNDVTNSFPTAVHEGAHMMRAKDMEINGSKSNYSDPDQIPQSLFTLDGTKKSIPSSLSQTFAPKQIIKDRNWPQEHAWVDTYLRGEASSKDSLSYLLDELNSYTLDADSILRIKSKDTAGKLQYGSAQDGLLSMMDFLSVYVNKAKANDPKTWKIITSESNKNFIKQLWLNAEATLAKTCLEPKLYTSGENGGLSGYHLNEIYILNKPKAIEDILGQKLILPQSCKIHLNMKRSISNGQEFETETKVVN